MFERRRFLSFTFLEASLSRIKIWASTALTVLLAGAIPFGQPSHAAEAKKFDNKIGTLRCSESSGWGLVFKSTKSLKCVYVPVTGGTALRYSGTVDKYGIDIGYTEGAVIIWQVLATHPNVGTDALAGKYSGVSAQATAGYGLGANALVGGVGKAIALQPFSVSGQKGLNLAFGIATVTIKEARQ